MFNNFTLSKVDDDVATTDHVVMVHTGDDSAPAVDTDDHQRWRVRRRNSIDVDRQPSYCDAQPRVGRTNSIYNGATDSDDTDSGMSEPESDEELPPELHRRHSMPSLHPSPGHDMVKYLVSPNSETITPVEVPTEWKD